MKFKYRTLSLLFLALSLHAKAEETTTEHMIQLPLQPLSITCEHYSYYRGYKIRLSTMEATITPSIESPSFSLYSTGSEGFYAAYNDCLRAVRDIHRRYPNGASFQIRRTVKVSWEPGCRNHRCPEERYEKVIFKGSFDGRSFSSNPWE